MKTGYFFDMDGTLYDNTFHSISYKTIHALQQILDQKDFVFLATSRCKRELDHLPKEMRDFPFTARILDGGSYILDNENNIIENDPINIELMNQIDKYCKENDLLYRYSTRNGNYFGTKPNQTFYELEHSLYLCAPEYKPYQNDKVLNLLVCTKTKQQEQKIKEIVENCSIIFYPECLEIRANGKDKASAIQLLKAKYKLDKILCFGDGANDIEMLKRADIGIAIGNACSPLKDIADVIIQDCDQDGIYHYLLEQHIIKEV